MNYEDKIWGTVSTITTVEISGNIAKISYMQGMDKKYHEYNISNFEDWQTKMLLEGRRVIREQKNSGDTRIVAVSGSDKKFYFIK